VGHLPWSSFRPNKGTLGGGFCVWCKALQGIAENRREKTRKILFFSDWSVVFL